MFVIGSTNQMYPPDLDWRPGEMARSTLEHQVAECSKCHYCAPDLAKKPQSEAARKVIARPMPGHSLADKFARAAEIMAAEATATEFNADGMLQYSGVFFLRAAWSCDDRNEGQKAAEFRRKAAEKLEQAVAKMIGANREVSPEMLVMLCDIYRRIGEFEKAEKLAHAAINYKSRPQRMAELQLKLCREKKTDRHTLGEVSSYKQSFTIVVGGK